MNYIAEINAFSDRMDRAPLSTNAQVLWYKLMQFCNRLRWAEEFQVDNERLMRQMNVSSQHTFRAARKELEEDGLISFTPGVKGRPTLYKLHSVAALEGFHIPQQDDEPDPTEFLYEVREDITTYFGYTEALGKELQTVTDAIWEEFLPGKRPSPGDVRQVFFYIMDQTQDENGDYIMSFPEERKKMLAYAFSQAQLNGAVSWNYIRGIYSKWGNRGTNTMQKIFDYEYERDQRK